jgi:hypothetical protein
MKVKELIAALQKINNQDLEVLSSDHDYWFYDISSVQMKFIYDGREVEVPDDTNDICVCLIP